MCPGYEDDAVPTGLVVPIRNAAVLEQHLLELVDVGGASDQIQSGIEDILHVRQSWPALRQRLPDRTELGSIGLRNCGILVLDEHLDEVDLEFVFTDLEDLKSALSVL
jgi:hypothetical protein